jgi:hypothetical protein
MALLRHKVLDIRRQIGKAIQCIILPILTAFPACNDGLGKMKEKLAALQALEDWVDSA